MYGMTVEDLIILNELKSNEVKPGKILFVSRNLYPTNNGGDDDDEFREYYNNSNNGRNTHYDTNHSHQGPVAVI